MRNNETGEFELVVGNKQLLSGFFVVVVLFALAFVMGMASSIGFCASLDVSPTGASFVTPGSTSKFNRLEKKEKRMMISNVEPDLRQIIQSLRDGNLEMAKDRTVELIESACRMSGPMYREETMQPGPQPERPTYNRAAGKLRILTKDLRDVSFTMRRGTQVDALEMAERALVVFLRPEAVART